MDAPRPVTLEQFAAITAQLDAGLPRDRVLDGAGLSTDAWASAQAIWLARMAAQAAQKRLALHRRYGELLEAARLDAQQRLRADKRRADGPLPLAPVVSVPMIPHGPFPPVRAEAAEPAVPLALAAVDVRPPALIAEVPPPARVPAPAPRYRPGATLDVPMMSPFATTGFPFATPTPRAQPPAPSALKLTGLPFAAPSPSMAIPPSRPAAPPTGLASTMPAAEEPARPPNPLKMTGLPFAVPAADEPARPPNALKMTGLPFAPAPVAAPSGAPAPRLTLEQLAWLRAMLTAAPARAAEACARLGLTVLDYAREESLWAPHLARDPALAARCAQLADHYRLTAAPR